MGEFGEGGSFNDILYALEVRSSVVTSRGVTISYRSPLT
jgi:hypothetical protein